ncbi:MAG: shikimate kinase [Oscillospiraceae bacterium]|nr:shikimate kinase [Oscillospiraceae bacterium]
MQCGLLGRKLSHSYSPQIHASLGDYRYNLYEVEPEDLESFLTKSDFDGLNVTIPYKKAVIDYCDELSPRAKQLGAVNTLVRKNGKLIGHNTDYFGFQSMIEKCGISVTGKKALVLGSGGASATAVAVLTEMGARVVTVSRSGPDNYQNLDRHSDAAIIVNATPVGMYPETEESILSLDKFDSLSCVLDLIYNPANTQLLQQAQRRNIPCENGLWMLVAQAKESSEWFTGKHIPYQVIQRIHHCICFEMENIILIGMPGCGKTTVGSLLAQKLNRPFMDADRIIEEKAGISIPEIFATQGEPGFRSLETQVLSEICKISGAVISTGGGCVTRPENYPLLHQNGKIIWLQRNIRNLAVDGRPLSQVNTMEDMYMHRRPLYQKFSDCSVDNNTDPMSTVQEILRYFEKEKT